MKHRNKLLFALLFSVCLCCVVVPVTAGHAPGMIVGWGSNDNNQALPPAGNDYVTVDAGESHSIALLSNGSIEAWGRNDFNISTPPEGNDYVAIAAGGMHSLALQSNGSIVGWGYNGLGQATPPGGNDFVAIDAGFAHSLSLRSDGSIAQWGDTVNGQGTAPTGNDYVAIAAGFCHSLALRSNGSIIGWGRNTFGCANPPAGNDFVAIAAGSDYSLALRSNGSIYAWGDNSYGQCNYPEGNDFVAIAAGNAYSLALRSNGSIYAWGDNSYGQCNYPEGNDFVAIAAGYIHGLALKTPFWSSPGGHTLNCVAMDANSTKGEWYAIIRGTDNHLYFNKYTYSTNSWAGWTAIGGTTNDEPVVAYTGENSVHVVIRGTDNVLYYKQLNLNTNTWDNSWTSLGGHTLSAPTLLSWSSAQIPGDPKVFPDLWLAVRGSDNHLYTKNWTPSTGWTPSWQAWGGTTYDHPALAYWFSKDPGESILTLGVRGTDNKVYLRSYISGSGSLGPWISPGGSTLNQPVLRYKDGALYIVVRGTDNHMYLKTGSSPYIGLGGTTNDLPAAYSWPDQPFFEISIRGTDNKVYDKVLNLETGQWTGWTYTRASTASHPTFSRGTGSNGVLAIRGTDSGVYVHVV